MLIYYLYYNFFIGVLLLYMCINMHTQHIIYALADEEFFLLLPSFYLLCYELLFVPY